MNNYGTIAARNENGKRTKDVVESWGVTTSTLFLTRLADYDLEFGAPCSKPQNGAKCVVRDNTSKTSAQEPAVRAENGEHFQKAVENLTF